MVTAIVGNERLAETLLKHLKKELGKDVKDKLSIEFIGISPIGNSFFIGVINDKVIKEVQEHKLPTLINKNEQTLKITLTLNAMDGIVFGSTTYPRKPSKEILAYGIFVDFDVVDINHDVKDLVNLLVKVLKAAANTIDIEYVKQQLKQQKQQQQQQQEQQQEQKQDNDRSLQLQL